MDFKLFRLAALCCTAGVALTADASDVRKKYVAFGWEFKRLTPKMILENAEKFRDTGYDGIGIYLSATNSVGKELMFVTRGDKWEREAFREQIPVFREILKVPQLSESFFVGYGSSTKRFDWKDDAAWENLANSMSVLGWLTRETGVKGISCDFEDYHHQHQYNRLDTDPEWEELLPIVRRRGAQVFGALFRENPDLKVLFYWILCFNTEYLTSPFPRELARQNRDLQPAFFDGILDVMPETARLINGDEHTYRAEAVKRDFHNSFINQRTVCPRLVSPENRAKFLRLTQVSFAIYSDMYANDEKSFWYFPPVGGSRAEHLRRNLLDATRLADEYVWFWGEKNPSVKYGNARIEPRVRNNPVVWEEAIPGMTEALLCCKDPDWGVSRRMDALRKSGKLADLNPNPSCRSGKEPAGKLPAPYFFWKGGKDVNGKVFLDKTEGYGDKTSIALKDCSNACAMYSKSKVAPGEVYVLDLAAKGPVTVSIAFQNKKNWIRGMQSVSPVFGKPNADGWRRGRAVVVVPAPADTFVVKMGFEKMNGISTVWFDDIHLYRLW